MSKLKFWHEMGFLKGNALVVFLFGFLWLLLMRTSYELNVYSQFFLRFPAAGVSFWKGYLFCVWLMICGLACLRVQRHFFRPMLCLSAILLTYSLGVLIHCYLSGSYDFPFWKRGIFVANESISSHSLIHSHVLKGAMAWLLEVLHIAAPRPADTGLPFLAFVPSLVFAVSVIFYLVACLLILSTVRWFFAKDRFSLPSLFFISVLSYYVVRTLIDGGLLSADALAALGLLTLILIRERFFFQSRWMLMALMSLVIVVEIFRPQEDQKWIFLIFAKDLLIALCFLIGLGTALIGGGAWRGRIASACLLFAAAFYLNRDSFFHHDIEYLNRVFAAGQTIRITARSSDVYPGDRIVFDGQVSVWDLALKEPLSNWELHKIHRVPPGYRVVSDQCSLNSRFVVKGKILMMDFTRPKPQSCSGGVAPRLDLSWSGNTGTYSGELMGCLADTGGVATAFRLMECGLDRFIMIAAHYQGVELH